jgi:hypothetical protein
MKNTWRPTKCLLKIINTFWNMNTPVNFIPFLDSNTEWTHFNIVTDLAILQIWTLILNDRVRIWRLLRNDFPNRRCFSCDRCYSTATQEFLTVKSFLSNRIVAMENTTVRESLLFQAQTLYLRGRQTQIKQHPCGGGVEYLHRDPASRRRWRKWKSQLWDSKIRSQVPRD